MKKFIVKDEDGNEYDVSELSKDEEVVNEEEVTENVSEKNDAELTSEDIAALKSLAANASKILSLLNVEEQEHAAVAEDEDESSDVDVDTDEDGEEIIDTDETEQEKKMAHDSKSSVGSISKKRAKDSIDDFGCEIENAWAKRYNGGKQ